MKASAATFLVLGWSVLRSGEVWLSVTNTLRLLNAGAKEYCPKQHPWLLAATASAGFMAGFASMVAPTVSTSIQVAAAVGFVSLESLHVWAIATLGRRWTTGVIVLKGEAPIRRGPYRWLTHPGYLGGATAAALLPLAAGNWQMCLVASLALAVVVTMRIRCENAAWQS